MNVIQRPVLWMASLLCLAGCQVCCPSLKKACVEDACGPEIHVRAPTPKVVVHRDDCEAPCAQEKPSPVQAQGAPAEAPAKVQPQGQPAPRPQAPVAAMGQVAPQAVPQQMMAAAAAPAGFAAIPTLPTNTAITLTFDVIRIPIPIPRLRTVDVPPETRLSFVQLGASSAIGAVAAAPTAMAMAPVAPQAAYVQQAAAVQPVAVEAQGDVCIRPEHVAAAAAMLKSQSAASQAAASAGTATAAADPRLKVIEELERRCDELEKKKAAMLKSQSNWRAPKEGE